MHPCLGGTPQPTDPASGKQQPTDLPRKVSQSGWRARQCSLGGCCLPYCDCVWIRVRARCSPCGLMTKACGSYTRTEERRVKGDGHRVLWAAVVPVLLVVVIAWGGSGQYFFAASVLLACSWLCCFCSLFSLARKPQSDLSELLPSAGHIISSIHSCTRLMVWRWNTDKSMLSTETI